MAPPLWLREKLFQKSLLADELKAIRVDREEQVSVCKPLSLTIRTTEVVCRQKGEMPAHRGGRMAARLKAHLLNAALVAASVLLTYVLLEVAVFRVFLPFMPLKVRPDLPDRAEVLAQNSKRNYLPHDYIALLGDSYAEGRGDWLLEGGGNRNQPFHSADIIHEMTGRDVVSFARGGAGSAEGIVLRPARIFTSTRCFLFPEMEIPRQMFIYFYEGNDMEDNIRFLSRVSEAYGRVDPEAIDRYLNEYYAAENPWRCHLELMDTATRMVGFLYQHYVAGLDVDYCGYNRRANRLVVRAGPGNLHRTISGVSA